MFRGDRANNFFTLKAYGQEMLSAGENYAYTVLPCPLTVDGKAQFAHAGIPNKYHCGPMVSAWRNPNSTRWHVADHFNLAEGVYAGPYGDVTGAGAIHYRDAIENFAKASAACMHGITHQRLVHFLRSAGVWIITDRLNCPKKRTYTQVWRLPVGRIKGHRNNKLPTFSPDKIIADAKTRTIKTQTDGIPNISLYQFGKAKMAYRSRKENTNIGALKAIETSWTGEAGGSVVVTLVYPRRTVKDDVKSVEPLAAKDASGFKATLSDGRIVWYMAAQGKEAGLSAADISCRAEALLVTTSGKAQRGIVLGCKALTVDGKEVALAHPDFEFTVHPKLAMMPIYRPIQPVEIGPADRDVFAGSQEITLSCPTPGVGIRYTLDGSDPTIHSSLYKEAFVIKDRTVVKARGYRPGLTSEPLVQSGTHASPVYRAAFTRRNYLRAVRPKGKVTSGLDFAYYEGPWRRVTMQLYRLSPIKRGTVKKLFDISAREETKEPFAFRYQGYIEVPADGVYTFFAPDYLVSRTIEPGCTLQVYVGKRKDDPIRDRRALLSGERWYRYDDQGLLQRVSPTPVVGLIGQKSGELNQWYPGTRAHAFGTWSIALKKGLHPFVVEYADYRGDACKKYNHPELIRQYVWDGKVPELAVSGPGLAKRPLPASWLRRELPAKP